MDNQHKQIKGYRDLSQVEIDLMNKITQHGQELESLVEAIKSHLLIQDSEAFAAAEDGNEYEFNRLHKADPYCWATSAEFDFQVALMKLTRSIAQPTTF